MSQNLRTKAKEIFIEVFKRSDFDILHLHPDQLEIIIDETTERISEIWTEYLSKDISYDELLFKEDVFVEYLANMIKEFGEKGGG